MIGCALIRKAVSLAEKAYHRHVTCRYLGCEPSWVLGLSSGLDRPICYRCEREL